LNDGIGSLGRQLDDLKGELERDRADEQGREDRARDDKKFGLSFQASWPVRLTPGFSGI
jgi:hypothetical protein